MIFKFIFVGISTICYRRVNGEKGKTHVNRSPTLLVTLISFNPSILVIDCLLKMRASLDEPPFNCATLFPHCCY